MGINCGPPPDIREEPGTCSRCGREVPNVHLAGNYVCKMCHRHDILDSMPIHTRIYKGKLDVYPPLRPGALTKVYEQETETEKKDVYITPYNFSKPMSTWSTEQIDYYIDHADDITLPSEPPELHLRSHTEGVLVKRWDIKTKTAAAVTFLSIAMFIILMVGKAMGCLY